MSNHCEVTVLSAFLQNTELSEEISERNETQGGEREKERRELEHDRLQLLDLIAHNSIATMLI